jgi:hypothetical protein
MKPALTALLLMAAGHCGAQSVGAVLSPEAKADFEWFRSLGYPEVKDAAWVEVTRGVEGGPRAMVAQGFLLKNAPESISLLLLDLHVRSIQRKMLVAFQGAQNLDWEEKPFPEVAREYAVGLDEEERDPVRDYQPLWGLRLGLKAQAFVMAQACWEKGLPDEAQAIYEAARKVPPWPMGRSVDGQDSTLREAVERELAHAATWRAILAFGGADFAMPQSELVPRRDLLETFQKLEKNFPRNPHGERVKSITKRLEQMVTEDAAHPKLSAREIAALPIEEQVREWIFRLRDQNGRQWSQPGYCDIFGELGGQGSKDSPAHQLVKVGYPAVPLLIDALDDERLTRSVEFSRDFFFSHDVLTVSDAARQILNRIAGENFLNSVGKPQPEHQEKSRADFRAAVEKWWKDFRENGEEQSLAARLSRGLPDPRQVVARLKEIAPTRVESALVAGAENSGGNSLYLEELGTLGTPAAKSCLGRIMKSGRALRTRVDAARELWKLGDPSAVPAMISEWNVLPPDAVSAENWGHPALIQILVVSGEKRAIKALARGWKDRCLEQRRDVVDMLGDAFITEDNKRQAWGIPRKPEPAAVRVAEALLAEALEDLAVCEGRGGALREYAILDPRIADFALFALSRNFPKDYTISVTTDLDVREAERQQALRVWKEKTAAVKATEP